ncbi:MAG: class I SAM-dependent methyltransferase [Cyclobacteriaceae bacterium]|jgi:ubiquinone/menaquinone biosynthesis C-methylase UbiE
MNTKSLLFSFLFFAACAPYSKGPVFTKDNAKKTFQPIIEFLEVKPGMAVADVGAGSGALTVIMSTQLDSCSVYIQDIDRDLLQQKNVDKMIAYYSKQLGYPLGDRNHFYLVFGSTTQSNLPDASLDLIYSNATMHALTEPDVMLQDLRKKLKPTGKIFIRDSFRDDHNEGPYCSDKKCGRPLYTVNQFLAKMTKNGFQLVKQSQDMSGYPVFGFALQD